jgi:hypothetical protein
MPDFEKIWNTLVAVLKLVFGENLPPQVKKWIGIILSALLILLFVWLVLFALSKIVEIIREKFIPLFYNADERRRNTRRRQFADHLESEIRRLNNLEAWHDYRFTDLEAEVEAEGQRRKWKWLPFFTRTQIGLRRERSLLRALEKTEERLILIEGEPGSGKSVALRYVAQQMAKRAMKARNNRGLIPIYVNLKDLERRKPIKVDRKLIADFILRSLNRANDRDIEEFLEEEFDRGLQEGTWLFLFDSFDEISEVLSATEANEAIKNYGQAISDFLHGMNKCRGIIASRQYRGPGMLGWPRFRILPLQKKRRGELIQLANLSSTLRTKLMEQLSVAGEELYSMAGNPMFLGLLCDHLRADNPFPEHPHTIFETYLSDRLRHDGERLKRRYNLDSAEVREASEKIAFCMTADAELGLSPTRRQIKAATEKHKLPLGNRFDVLLDALEYIKLARAETAKPGESSKSFTFAHRRFQEYFATCVVLREPWRVSAQELLTDARWRETAVVMCQTQPKEVLSPILVEVDRVLVGMNDSLPNLMEKSALRDPSSIDREKTNEGDRRPELFQWPDHSIHLLGLLQDGFHGRVGEIPDAIREKAADLITTADVKGVHADRKWGLEVAGILPQSALLGLLRKAFNSNSWLIYDIAYKQVTKLERIPEDIAKEIRRTLSYLLHGSQFRTRYIAARAHIARLKSPEKFFSILRLLRWIRPFHFVLSYCFAVLSIVAWFSKAPNAFANRPSALVWAGVFMVITMLLAPMTPLLQASGDHPFDVGNQIFMGFITMMFPGFLIYSAWADFTWGVKLVILCFVYSVLWLSAAISAVKNGKFTHPLFWPILPAFTIPSGVKEISARFISWVAGNRKMFLSRLTMALSAILLLGAIVCIVVLSIYFAQSLPFIRQYKGEALLIFMLVGFLWLTRVMIKTHRGTLKDNIDDRTRLKRFINQSWDRITESEFFELLMQYRTNKYRLRFVRHIRREKLLTPSRETGLMLRSLAFLVEKEPMLLDIGCTQEEYLELLEKSAAYRGNLFRYFVNPSADYEDARRSYSAKNADLLDELSLLLEQVNANHDDSGA